MVLLSLWCRLINFTNLTNWRHIDDQIISFIHLLNLISCSWCKYLLKSFFETDLIVGVIFFYFLSFHFVGLRDVFLEEKCFLWIWSKRGRALPNFLAHFQEVKFWSIKESISSKMPIIWTLNFFSVVKFTKFTKFTKCVYIVYEVAYIVFWVRDWLSNLELRRRKKLCKLSKLRGKVILTRSKRKHFFSGEHPLLFLSYSLFSWNPLSAISYFCHSVFLSFCLYVKVHLRSSKAESVGVDG